MEQDDQRLEILASLTETKVMVGIKGTQVHQWYPNAYRSSISAARDIVRRLEKLGCKPLA